VAQGIAFAERIGYPAILRPSFHAAASGAESLTTRGNEELLEKGLELSPVHEVLVEERAGWKEFELEVMRDLADNAIIICSIENFDPMGYTRATQSRWLRRRR